MSKFPTDYDYARVVIKGTLTTQSPLHIGTGEEHQEEGDKDKDNSITINSLALDTEGKPYIPASSLRGLLRSLCQDQPQAEKLFGSARQAKESEYTGRAGALRLYDAKWAGTDQDSVALQKISRTCIDPVTHTAKHHQLSTHHQVPIDTVFNVELHLDRVNSDDISLILASLEALEDQRIGQGKSIGQGAIKWQLDPTQSTVLTKNKLRKWLNAPKRHALKPTALSSDLKKEDKRLIDKLATDLRKGWHTQPLTLIAHSPLLINDPHEVAQIARDNPDSKDNPDVTMLKQQGKAIIPASTLKGWVRAHCRRILYTIAGDNAEPAIIDGLMDQLFGGTTTGISRLHFSDIHIAPHHYEAHQQSFIAVDRFTGGVKQGAMCQVEAIHLKQAMTTTLRYQDNLDGWMKLILLYCVRDAIEGDLILGWGKSKGFGRLQLDADFDQLLEQYDESQRHAWQQDLEEKLA